MADGMIEAPRAERSTRRRPPLAVVACLALASGALRAGILS